MFQKLVMKSKVVKLSYSPKVYFFWIYNMVHPHICPMNVVGFKTMKKFHQSRSTWEITLSKDL